MLYQALRRTSDWYGLKINQHKMTIDYQSVLLTSFLALTSAIIGGFISYYFTSKSKKLEAILKFREEKYSNLLILLQGFVGNTTGYEIKITAAQNQFGLT